MVFRSRLSVGTPPAHPPEERPPVEFVTWNAGFGWNRYHLTPDKQAARTFCGREIPRQARVSYEPPIAIKLQDICVECLKAYSTNYEEAS